MVVSGRRFEVASQIECCGDVSRVGRCVKNDRLGPEICWGRTDQTTAKLPASSEAENSEPCSMTVPGLRSLTVLNSAYQDATQRSIILRTQIDKNSYRGLQDKREREHGVIQHSSSKILVGRYLRSSPGHERPERERNRRTIDRTCLFA